MTIATKTPGTNEPGNPLELSKHINVGAHCWTTAGVYHVYSCWQEAGFIRVLLEIALKALIS
ncbi:MAG: hypothetical protein AB8I58_12950 [Anaerolineales bacterium]